MQALIHFFSSVGMFATGCVIVALAAAAIGYCGTFLSVTITVGFFKKGTEDYALSKFGLWIVLFGALWALYIICSVGLIAAFLASAGLALACGVLGWLIWMFAPGFNLPLDPDFPY